MIFYRPTHPETGEMWDTWLFWHEGMHYLFYLAKAGEKWDNISMATSRDGIRWSEMGPILKMRPGATWMGTGSTWADPMGNGFLMNFSEWRGARQTIFFAHSPDLLNWRRLGDDLEFSQDERWYDPMGRWDCIWTQDRLQGGYHGYWSATPRPETGGRFGFGRSVDGLHWEALPPPMVHGVREGEVGAIERFGSRYYMLFGSYPQMWTLVAENPEGPFRIARKNSDLLGGHTYFTRFYSIPGSMLVCHHSMAVDGHIHLGLLKRADVDDAGTLRLAWWGGNDLLAGEWSMIHMPSPEESENPILLLPSEFEPDIGILLKCRLELPSTPFARRRGVAIECSGGSQVLVLFDAQGRAELGQAAKNRKGYEVVRHVDRELGIGCAVDLRLVLAGALMEIYLDEYLIDCFSLPSRATGRIGIIPGDKWRSITSISAAACTGG